jgi:glycosyltransferase involved in cell wall biosynthesis
MARYCAVIPTYDNEATVAAVVASVRRSVPDVIVVDDGSHAPARAVAESLAEHRLADVVFRGVNGGKGAAVSTGLEAAYERGFTHALQIDADGQHDVNDIARMLDASRANEAAFVMGQPIFDATAPRSRLWGRRVSVFFARVETWSRRVGDPLCGFRVYPVKEALEAGARGRAMDFDPEIAVRLAWAGVPIVHVPTRVRYIAREQGGVSHYRGFADTWRISLMHARLCFTAFGRLVASPWRGHARNPRRT